jgi:hypothetical protein
LKEQKDQGRAQQKNDSMEVKKIFQGNLPLQTETNFFILANVLDVYMTYLLLRHGAIEANPLANQILQQWGFNAMVWFKLVIVAVVCIIAQLIATRRTRTARGLLFFGTLLVGAVVVYSMGLFITHFL